MVVNLINLLISILWAGAELISIVIIILLFFAGQRIRSKRKAARKLGRWLPSLTQLPSAVIKTRFAQTVYDLLPQVIASLGCVLKGKDLNP